MKQSEAIEKLLSDNNKSKSWLAGKMGIKQNAISQMLKRGNVTIDTLQRICDALEYEITIQPVRRAGARPQGQILIEGEVKEK